MYIAINKYFDLIKNLIISDLKLRYKNTIIGFLWSLLYPLIMMLVLYVVFSRTMEKEIANYILYLLLGIILWNFFSTGTLRSLRSIVSNMEIIKKIYFPRIFFVISAVISSFISCIFELVVFFIFYIFIFKYLPFHVLWIIPLIFLEFILILSIGLLLSSLYCFCRDLLPIWQIILKIGFFITPIFYSADRIPEKFLNLYLINPVTRLLILSRKSLLLHINPSFGELSILMLGILVLSIAGILVFFKTESYFPRYTI